MRDALKSYLALASGVTDVTRQRALEAAKALVAQGEAAAEQVSALAEDLVAQTRQNREAVVALVGFEVDRALSRVGLATVDEVTELTERVRALEAELVAASSSVDSSVDSSRAGGVGRVSGRGAGGKGAAEEPTGRTAVAGTSGEGAQDDGAPAKKGPAKKAPAKKAPAKKAPAKQAPGTIADEQPNTRAAVADHAQDAGT